MKKSVVKIVTLCKSLHCYKISKIIRLKNDSEKITQFECRLIVSNRIIELESNYQFKSSRILDNSTRVFLLLLH